jgi:hypothetical protein
MWGGVGEGSEDTTDGEAPQADALQANASRTTAPSKPVTIANRFLCLIGSPSGRAALDASGCVPDIGNVPLGCMHRECTLLEPPMRAPEQIDQHWHQVARHQACTVSTA